MIRISEELSDEMGRSYSEAKWGEQIEGVYRCPVELSSGRYALIENSRTFKLVPRKPVVDRQISVAMGHESINRTFCWQHGGVSLS